MWFFYLTGILLFLSLAFNRAKTKKALLITYKRFKVIFPSFLIMLIFVSIILFLFPQEKIIQYLDSGYHIVNVVLAALVGSVTIMPGFVAFPLAGILRNSGISYMIIASFTTTLMMVGTMTFPIEVTYFGKKVSLIRNLLSFIIAIIIAVVVGIYFGEVTL
ncbi:MAG: hypothetical protein WCV43_04415 [Candidatus Caldatribacteriota bacterium]|jgi:uncharacterized membrane protein YraQ (UPF0718 family)|nr:hypothetical protein [Atribacterota bacterium]MDD3031866.1 hypothetical protein [Atribacterota bacterium]MDD3641330.1 hypothetical protein [Atribacterota bacterium]MDD4288783.1 hypothetical protein [Atribacterota bacterium]